MFRLLGNKKEAPKPQIVDKRVDPRSQPTQPSFSLGDHSKRVIEPLIFDRFKSFDNRWRLKYKS